MADCRHLGGFALAAALLLIANCRDARVKIWDGEWASWLDQTAKQIPRATPKVAVASEWHEVRSPDGLLLRLDAEYLKRNESGCWAKLQRLGHSPAWRDVCVRRVRGWIEPPQFFLKPQRQDVRVAHAYSFEDWHVEAISFGSRRAIVERAKGTGGVEGAQRERMAVVFVELKTGEWAVLNGRTGEDEGYDELVSVASTINPVETVIR